MTKRYNSMDTVVDNVLSDLVSTAQRIAPSIAGGRFPPGFVPVFPKEQGQYLDAMVNQPGTPAATAGEQWMMQSLQQAQADFEAKNRG